MGEYINLHGQSYKVGTCESLYYARFADLQKWGGDARAYLVARHGFRYRFPFPDEDSGAGDGTGLTNKYQSDYDRGVTIASNHARILFENEETGEHYHRERCEPVYPVGQQGGGYHFNVFHACPQAPDCTDRTSPKPPFVYQIVSQKQVDGCLWTCIRCAYCGSLIRITKEQAVALAADIMHQYPEGHDAPAAEFHREVARRMVAGYDTKTQEQHHA